MAEAKDAYREWWLALSRQGDPLRHGNLSYKAFVAGYEAGWIEMNRKIRSMMHEDCAKRGCHHPEAD
jgi:ribosomal protein L20